MMENLEAEKVDIGLLTDEARRKNMLDYGLVRGVRIFSTCCDIDPLEMLPKSLSLASSTARIGMAVFRTG
jgi:hypothetical protein